MFLDITNGLVEQLKMDHNAAILLLKNDTTAGTNVGHSSTSLGECPPTTSKRKVATQETKAQETVVSCLMSFYVIVTVLTS